MSASAGGRPFLIKGGDMTFNVPEILSSAVYGYEYFNFFCTIPMAVLTATIIPLVCIKMIMKS